MILVVCTGNLHRSALLEAVLRKDGFSEVESAGTRAVGGGAPALMIEAAAEAGIDLGSHVSRQVTRQMVSTARLVIAMERAHIAEISVMHPPAFDYAVTLRELRDLLAQHPPRSGQHLSAWLRTALAGRTAMGVLRANSSIDTPDPIGGKLDTFRESVADICATALPVCEGLRSLKF